MSDVVKRIIEVDDAEAEKILEAARHKQIQQSFAKLTEAVIASNSDDKLLAAAEKQTFAIQLFAEAIKQIELNPTEIVSSLLQIRDDIVASNKELNQTINVSSLLQIRDDIVASNKELNQTINTRLLPDTFTLNKYGGVTESVKVNYKPANQITVKN